MPGRYPVYPEGTETVNVPLTLSREETNFLEKIAPSRSAAARIVIQARINADQVARGVAETPEDLASLYDAMASCVRLKRLAETLQQDELAQALESRRKTLATKASRVHTAGLTVNA